MSIEMAPVNPFYASIYRCTDSLNACEPYFPLILDLFFCVSQIEMMEFDQKAHTHVVLEFLYVHRRVAMAMLILSLLSYYSLDR